VTTFPKKCPHGVLVVRVKRMWCAYWQADCAECAAQHGREDAP
jgi:hypothetical protein